MTPDTTIRQSTRTDPPDHANRNELPVVTPHPEIDLRMRCKCKGIAYPVECGGLYLYQCTKCKKFLIHAQSCNSCTLKGTPHEAEFNDLKDEDGSQFLNLIGEKIDPGTLSWVALHGCKTFRSTS